jgi:hypothetical protein
MAWTEQISKQSWRVRYHTGDGHTASISGFATKLAADNYANDIESDQRPSTTTAACSAATSSFAGALPRSTR